MKQTVAVLLLLCAIAKANPFHPRVTGGQPVVPHSRPFQVALNVIIEPGKVAFCGGSILSENAVLSAAHCLQDAQQVKVIVGAHNISTQEDTQQIYFSTVFVVHEDWSMLTLRNDIGIIKTEAMALNSVAQKIILPSPELIVEDEIATVSGWGLTSDTSTTVSDVLNEVSNNLLPLSVCNIYYFGLLGQTHVCLKGNNGMSSCRGDSGGPLTVVVADQTVQIGIVSFGIAFGCEVGFPSVYTYVPKYIDWINTALA
ncbi:hypothetical protein FQR65_LT02008 [Abscondita terminalis]|nr:hypothetical protein FQR65_LT02008 [Abscondita terminalis]